MMTDAEMTDAEVADQIERADRFIADFREMIAATVAAMRGGLLDLIEVSLMCVGAGPTLDFADAAAFLAGFQPMIDKALISFRSATAQSALTSASKSLPHDVANEFRRRSTIVVTKAHWARLNAFQMPAAPCCGSRNEHLD